MNENRLPDGLNHQSVLKQALEVGTWARKVIHGAYVPAPTLRKRLAGSAFALAIDLHGSSCCLAACGAQSGVLTLARSNVESYLRGFWLAYIAEERLIDSYAKGRYTKTLKPLMQLIQKSKVAPLSRLGIRDSDAALLDDITHGGLGHMKLRNIEGYEIGSPSSPDLMADVLLLGSTIIVSCVEHFVRAVLDDPHRSLELFEEGGKFFVQFQDMSEKSC